VSAAVTPEGPGAASLSASEASHASRHSVSSPGQRRAAVHAAAARAAVVARHSAPVALPRGPGSRSGWASASAEHSRAPR